MGLGELRRYYLKSKIEPLYFAVEGDDRGEVLAALDVSDDATKGGLCPHMLSTLPMASRIDDVISINKNIADFEVWEPECGNTHHLLSDLLELERGYREATTAWESADSEAKALKKRMEAQGERVHQLLTKIQDRKPLPLFEHAA